MLFDGKTGKPIEDPKVTRVYEQNVLVQPAGAAMQREVSTILQDILNLFCQKLGAINGGPKKADKGAKKFMVNGKHSELNDLIKSLIKMCGPKTKFVGRQIFFHEAKIEHKKGETAIHLIFWL